MNVLVVGFGLIGGGVDAASYYVSHGHKVRVTDVRNEAALFESIDVLRDKGVVFHFEQSFEQDLQWADLVVKTHYMGEEDYVYPKTKEVVNDLSVLLTSPLISDVKLIFVAGAKNKTVTASAICHSLNEFGQVSHLCGNMGISGFSELERLERGEKPDFLVIELSFWQIRDTLGILDWDMPTSKLTVFTGLQDIQDANNELLGSIAMISDCVVCPHENKKLFCELFFKMPNKKSGNVFYVESVAGKLDKALPAKMQWALASLKRLGYETAKINESLKAFRGIPNRGELVCRTENCMFINDSSSSLPESVGFTVDNLSNMRVHLICGGYGKSLDPSGMEEALSGVASVHLLEGSFTNEKLIPLLENRGIDYHGPFISMKDAVASAQDSAGNDPHVMQVILLSPGVPALYFYKNEFYRGDCFRNAIDELLS